MRFLVKGLGPPRPGVMLIASLVVAAFGFTVNNGGAMYITKPVIGKDRAGPLGGGPRTSGS
jgi:hypothetical protein